MNSLAKQALKDVMESTEHFKKTLAEQRITLDDWLEKMRIKSEETRRRVMEKERKRQEAVEGESDGS
jgi:SMC interacting uncharacterized protein involved in chromosome segregation